ncbi:MAG: enoyl-CoA hydratase/isomerase family protein [bacterium]|nr:enoyl-CoA hydratase/isomerase family protein [bacterium]
MTENCITLERQEKIAVVTLNRPDKRNAFDLDMWSRLEQVTEELRKDLPRAIVITGAGNKAFSAGFDVNPENPQVAALIEAVKEKDREPVEKLVRYIRTTTGNFTSLPVPVIAAVNGICYGGGAEFAAQCDLRVTDPGAVFCFSEVRLGLMPDWGGGVALTRLLGQAAAADLVLTAREVGAEEARGLGLVNRVSAPGMALAEAIELAQSIAKNGPQAVRSALDVIRRTAGMPLEAAMELETATAADLITGGECFHGIGAFLAKKEPDFPDPS